MLESISASALCWKGNARKLIVTLAVRKFSRVLSRKLKSSRTSLNLKFLSDFQVHFFLDSSDYVKVNIQLLS